MLSLLHRAKESVYQHKSLNKISVKHTILSGWVCTLSKVSNWAKDPRSKWVSKWISDKMSK